MTPFEDFDVRTFRDTAGRYASGLTVVTGHDGDGPVGFTCQSFYSVSLDPPLVSISVAKTSTTYPRLRATGSFAVNVLARDQWALSDQFARSGTDRWKDVTWARSPSGNPVVDGVEAWFDCTISAEHDAGDHVVVLGHVHSLGAEAAPPAPLIYHQGRYRGLAPL